MNKSCSADYIEELIRSTPDGGLCRIPRGEYYLERTVNIRERSRITIDGQNSVIFSHYNNGSSVVDTCGAFDIFGCRGLKLCNLTLDTDTPVNMSGKVKSIADDNSYYILSVLPEYNTTGKETFMIQNSCDGDGSFDHRPDYYCTHPNSKNMSTLLAGEILLANTHTGCKYDYLGNSEYRVYPPDSVVKQLYVGQEMCIRHSSYGPVTILIKNSNDTEIENVTIHSAGGMGIIVLPRCENLRLDNFNVVLPENSRQHMSGNCDGIHIVGLCGRLEMLNCSFNGLGDDALNIHSTAASVTGLNEAESMLKCNYCKKSPDGILSPDWCREGDLITVLDPKACTRIGEFRVKAFEYDRLCYADRKGELRVGSVLQNTAFAASVEVKGCDIRNTRARGLLFQTEDIEVTDCSFFGMSLPAILAAPDVGFWYEVGPIKNMHIHGNTFKKCAFSGLEEQKSIITVKNSHDAADIIAYGVHSNICIENNEFHNKKGKCISILSTNGLKISNNRFIGCSGEDERIETVNCNG